MKRPKPLVWYAKVRVTSTRPALREIKGRLAAISGRAWSTDRKQWYYSITLYRPVGDAVGWCCYASDVTPTGEVDRRETFFSGESIRVSQDGEYLGPGRPARKRRST